MSYNKFRIQKLDKWRLESAEMFRSIGLRPSQYEELLGELADRGTDKIISSHSQLLLDLKDVGVSVIAERDGVCRRTVDYWRTKALNELRKKSA